MVSSPTYYTNPTTPQKLREHWDEGLISPWDCGASINEYAESAEKIREWLAPFEAGHRVRDFYTRMAISRVEAERAGEELISVGNGVSRDHPNLSASLAMWVDAGCP